MDTSVQSRENQALETGDEPVQWRLPPCPMVDFSKVSDRQLFPDGRCRLVLIGKTGAGKSSTGNAILGGTAFKAQAGINSETKSCGVAIAERNGLQILVMDTPGLCDTDGEDDIISRGITNSLFGVHPGPHALLLVLRCNARFTREEHEVLKMLKDIFGNEMTNHLIVIFAGKDELKGQNFEEQLEKSKHAKDLVKQAGNRYVLFNNKGSEQEKELQIQELLTLVRKVVWNNGCQYFCHRLSKALSSAMQELIREEVLLKRQSQLNKKTEGKEIEEPQVGMTLDPDGRASQDQSLSTSKEGLRGDAETALVHTDLRQSVPNLMANRKDEIIQTSAENGTKYPLDNNVMEQVQEANAGEEGREKHARDIERKVSVKERRALFEKSPQSGMSATGKQENPIEKAADPTQLTPAVNTVMDNGFDNTQKKPLNSYPAKPPKSSRSLRPGLTNGTGEINGPHPEESRQVLTAPRSLLPQPIRTVAEGTDKPVKPVPPPRSPRREDRRQLGEKTEEDKSEIYSDEEGPVSFPSLSPDPLLNAGARSTPWDIEKRNGWSDWSDEDDYVQIEACLVKELASPDENFVYEVPMKPHRSLAERQHLMEDAVLRKLISHQEQLTLKQEQIVDRAVNSVGERFRKEKAKFAVTVLEKCVVM